LFNKILRQLSQLNYILIIEKFKYLVSIIFIDLGSFVTCIN